MLQKESTNMCKGPLHDKYRSNLLLGIADHIITSALMQRKIKPETPLTLAEAMGWSVNLPSIELRTWLSRLRPSLSHHPTSLLLQFLLALSQWTLL